MYFLDYCFLYSICKLLEELEYYVMYSIYIWSIRVLVFIIYYDVIG